MACLTDKLVVNGPGVNSGLSLAGGNIGLASQGIVRAMLLMRNVEPPHHDDHEQGERNAHGKRKPVGICDARMDITAHEPGYNLFLNDGSDTAYAIYKTRNGDPIFFTRDFNRGRAT